MPPKKQQALIFPHDDKLRPKTLPDEALQEAAHAAVSVSRRLRAASAHSGGVPPAAAEEQEGESSLVPLMGLRVIVADPSEAPPQLETDESYTLEVRSSNGGLSTACPLTHTCT